jgi:hypothetical protein
MEATDTACHLAARFCIADTKPSDFISVKLLLILSIELVQAVNFPTCTRILELPGSAGTENIMVKDLRDFPKTLQANSWIVSVIRSR